MTGAAVALAAPARHALDPDLRRRHALAVAQPGGWRTKTERLWGNAIDDRPWRGKHPAGRGLPLCPALLSEVAPTGSASSWPGPPGRRLPFPIHPHMLRRGCGYELQKQTFRPVSSRPSFGHERVRRSSCERQALRGVPGASPCRAAVRVDCAACNALGSASRGVVLSGVAPMIPDRIFVQIPGLSTWATRSTRPATLGHGPPEDHPRPRLRRSHKPGQGRAVESVRDRLDLGRRPRLEARAALPEGAGTSLAATLEVT